MSIADRLGEAMTAAEACMEDQPADPNAVELAMKVPELVVAIQTVLELCDETPLRCRPYNGGEPFMVLGVPAIRSAVEAAFGESR